MQARTPVDGHALTERVEGLAVRAVAAFDTLAPALGVHGDIVAGARATIAAHLVRLPAATMHS